MVFEYGCCNSCATIDFLIFYFKFSQEKTCHFILESLLESLNIDPYLDKDPKIGFDLIQP